MNSRKKSGGRQRGTPNKTTIEFRDAIKQIVNSGLSTFEHDLKKLTPYQRLELIAKLIPFILPKPIPVQEITDNKIEVVYVEGKTIL